MKIPLDPLSLIARVLNEGANPEPNQVRTTFHVHLEMTIDRQ